MIKTIEKLKILLSNLKPFHSLFSEYHFGRKFEKQYSEELLETLIAGNIFSYLIMTAIQSRKARNGM